MRSSLFPCTVFGCRFYKNEFTYMNIGKRRKGRFPIRKEKRIILFVLLLILDASAIPKLKSDAAYFSMGKHTMERKEFRVHELTDDFVRYLRRSEEPGRDVGIFLAEDLLQGRQMRPPFKAKDFQKAEREWKKNPCYSDYKAACESIWNDVKYFPVMISENDPDLAVNYGDSWMSERTYGGTRGHEGTDLMASKNERGLYPIVSMTDGVVTSRGWLPKGGWRIGITSPHGGYFYYAHLDSYADAREGDTVKAGDIIGYMGDSGYGEEGTTGKFPVHLHLGIYLLEGNREISINPYWILRYIENSKLKCVYS